MSKFAREFLMMRDGRNPYGSRGGYVTSHDPRRRDRNMGDYDDYNRHDYDDYARYDDRRNHSMYSQSDYARSGRDYERSEQPINYYGVYSMNSKGRYEMDGRRGSMRGDYRPQEQFGKFSNEDIERWKHSMKNEDGTHGEHFTKEQIVQMARQHNIEFGEFDETVMCLAVNMMYSDYCKVAQKFGVNRIEFYIDMAKAFLKDKDFDGTPEEKLWLYYKCIVEE